VLGLTPPRLERLVPGLYDSAFLSFLVYFALYDFAAYWVHRAQHRFAWWWALHSLHHSQRRVDRLDGRPQPRGSTTCW
jgi:sterol desaturase/sphingolipid hydroxylase (fatty acid hydroxylase superfamily)